MLNRILKNLASLKLAVIIIILFATLISVGTFVEARYDATAAKKLVYNTYWMFAVMGLLAINLTAVMVDRWPWKARHTPFVLAHIGILILMAGSILTSEFGLDGNIRVGIGESNQYVTVPETDILIYSSFDGDRYTKLFEQEVDFFLHPASKEKPLVFPGYNTTVKFTGYKKYVLPSRKVVAAKKPTGRRGAGLRFQIQNPNVNVIEWLVQTRSNAVATHNFGPASLHLGPAPAQGRGANEIFFTPAGPDSMKYVVFQKDQEKPLKSGVITEGGNFDPGFKMAMTVRALRYLPEAEEEWELQDRDAPTPLTTSAARVEFNGQEHWILLNDSLRLFTDDAVYLVSYGNRRLDLGFPIRLANFEVDRYQGTMRAAAYKSKVEVPGLPLHEISMNEPLMYKGYRIYQASFQEDPQTLQPTASIFSVNKDPGRWIKYLGSLIMSIGIVMLFYFKQKVKKGKTP